MNSKETGNGSKECVGVDKDVNQILINQSGVSNDANDRMFTFDSVYGKDST